GCRIDHRRGDLIPLEWLAGRRMEDGLIESREVAGTLGVRRNRGVLIVRTALVSAVVVQKEKRSRARVHHFRNRERTSDCRAKMLLEIARFLRRVPVERIGSRIEAGCVKTLKQRATHLMARAAAARTSASSEGEHAEVTGSAAPSARAASSAWTAARQRNDLTIDQGILSPFSPAELLAQCLQPVGAKRE